MVQLMGSMCCELIWLINWFFFIVMLSWPNEFLLFSSCYFLPHGSFLMVSHGISQMPNWSSFQLGVERNPGFFGFLNFALWLAKKTRAVLSTNQIQNYKLRFKQFACFHFDFSLACDDVIDSRWDYFSFGFSTSIVKLLLYKTEINQPTDVSTVVLYCKFLS